MLPITTMDVVQGDTKYPLQFTLQDSTGAAIDLTGTTVSIKVQQFGGDGVKFTGTLTVDTPASGICHYDVQATDFDAEGRYRAEITITYPSGETLSYVNIVIVAAPKLPSA